MELTDSELSLLRWFGEAEIRDLRYVCDIDLPALKHIKAMELIIRIQPWVYKISDAGRAALDAAKKEEKP